MMQMNDLFLQIAQAYEFNISNRNMTNKCENNAYVIFIRTIKLLNETINNLKTTAVKYSIIADDTTMMKRLNIINTSIKKCKETMLNKIQLIDCTIIDKQLSLELDKLIKSCEPITVEYINSRKCFYVESIDLQLYIITVVEQDFYHIRIF